MPKPTIEELQAQIAALQQQLAAVQSGSGAQALGEDNLAVGARGIGVGGSVTDSTFVSGNQNQFTNIGSVASLTIQSAVFQAAPEPGAVPPKELLWNYLNQVLRDTATLDLSGVDRRTASDQEEARLELAAIFTELDTLRAREIPERGWRSALGRLAGFAKPQPADAEPVTREREPLIAFVNQHRYAALLGDPGSGKTTFARFLALALAGDLLGLQSVNRANLGSDWTAGPRLPVLVVLRQFAAQLDRATRLSAGDQLWDFIQRRLGQALAGFVPLLRRHLLTDGGILILDGLDEVPEADHTRELVKDAVLDFQRQFPKVRLLLTSRTYAYQKQGWRLPEFAEAVLAPFNEEQIGKFVDRWYAHIAAVRKNLTATEAAGRATLLKHAISRSDYLSELAQRPLLLTLMASLHAWRGGTLPERREQLYEESMELLLDVWERPKVVVDRAGQPVLQIESAAEWFRAPQARLREALEELAFDVHQAQKDLRSAADIPEDKLAGALLRVAAPDMQQAQVRDYIRDRAGLLINRGERVYCFPHRTFQEYLAARHLTHTGFPGRLVELARQDIERWREVLLLAGAKVARGTPFAAWSLVGKLCPEPCVPQRLRAATPTDFWMAMLAGQLLLDTGILTAGQPDPDDQQKLARVRDWLAGLVAGGHLPVADRAAAGVALGRLGDPRPGVGRRDGVPEIDWIEIPAGKFRMGSKEGEGYDDERPQFECRLISAPYPISRFPVTVEQYQAFVDAGGYADQAQRWWTQAGWQWRQREKVEGPEDYDPTYQPPNHPRVGVSWYEATAFCRWLTERLRSSRREEAQTPSEKGASLPRLLPGDEIRLPTEAQWERAARGTDGRKYPWGSEEDCAQRCNMGETGLGSTCAVGMFPTGNAACGAADLAGNVWEWCSTQWTNGYENYERIVNDDPEGGSARVLRGGSFINEPIILRCSYRFRLGPVYRISGIGFRVVCVGAGAR